MPSLGFFYIWDHVIYEQKQLYFSFSLLDDIYFSWLIALARTSREWAPLSCSWSSGKDSNFYHWIWCKLQRIYPLGKLILLYNEILFSEFLTREVFLFFGVSVITPGFLSFHLHCRFFNPFSLNLWMSLKFKWLLHSAYS